MKFLSRDKGTEVGYIIKFPIDPDPTSLFPAKYLRKVKLDGGGELGPPDQLQLHGHFEFALKDADGFQLLSLTGPGEYLAAASDNERQATVDEPVPASIHQRTKMVEVRLLIDDCTPCHPQ